MELTGKKWENFSTKEIEINKSFGDTNILKTLSLGELIDDLTLFANEMKIDGVNIYELPILIDYSYGQRFTINSLRNFKDFAAFSITDRNNKLVFEEPDVRPEFGEFCEIDYKQNNKLVVIMKTKKAAMRLLRTVKYVLEDDDIKSYVDIQDSIYAPIRFRFSGDEFNLIDLEDMIIENNYIVDEKILRKAVNKVEYF